MTFPLRYWKQVAVFSRVTELHSSTLDFTIAQASAPISTPRRVVQNPPVRKKHPSTTTSPPVQKRYITTTERRELIWMELESRIKIGELCQLRDTLEDYPESLGSRLARTTEALNLGATYQKSISIGFPELHKALSERSIVLDTMISSNTIGPSRFQS